MKKLSLNQVIKHERKNPEFNHAYEKELLINEIAKMVYQLRTSAHLTQAQLAEKAGTTQPVIARLESGADSRVPSLLLLARIAAASKARLHLAYDKASRF